MEKKVIGGHPDAHRQIFMDDLRVGTIRISCQECGKALVGRIPSVGGRGEKKLEKEISQIKCTLRGRVKALRARVRIFLTRASLFFK